MGLVKWSLAIFSVYGIAVRKYHNGFREIGNRVKLYSETLTYNTFIVSAVLYSWALIKSIFHYLI